MSLLDAAFGGDEQRFRFELPGDKLVGRVESRRTILSDYGEVQILTVRATAAIMAGEDKGAGGLWDLFCGSTYLRRFLEEADPLQWDYVLLRFEEERINPKHPDHATKVIIGIKKNRTAVEAW